MIPNIDKPLDGFMKDKKDPRDLLFRSSSTLPDLPTSVDLRQYTREIEDQGYTNSCVANATCSALELMTFRSGSDIDLSRMFVYWNVREPYTELRGVDEGAYMIDGFKSCSNQGVCSEDTWLFDEDKVNVKPDEASFTEDLDNVVTEYRRVNVKSGDDDGIKNALKDGYPVIIGMYLGKTFVNLEGPIETHNYKGILSYSDYWGGHAMSIVGYDDNMNGGSYILENSWSNDWGDDGFCAIPYSVVYYEGGDAWVCTEFTSKSTPVLPVPADEDDGELPRPASSDIEDSSEDKGLDIQPIRLHTDGKIRRTRKGKTKNEGR